MNTGGRLEPKSLPGTRSVSRWTSALRIAPCSSGDGSGGGGPGQPSGKSACLAALTTFVTRGLPILLLRV
jgi:hypothetical protein